MFAQYPSEKISIPPNTTVGKFVQTVEMENMHGRLQVTLLG